MKISSFSTFVAFAKQTNRNLLIFRKFHKKIRMQIFENLNWTSYWKQMKKTRSLKLYRIFAKKWNSIDFQIMCWQNHKKLFSFYSANLIHKINANIVENVEKNLRSRKIFFFLNQNKNISNWKCLNFWILKSSEWSKMNSDLLNIWMWFSKSSQTQWINSISNECRIFARKFLSFLIKRYWIQRRNVKNKIFC